MRIENYDYAYELTDEQLLYYSALPAIAKLRWLDQARRFTLLARQAREVEPAAYGANPKVSGTSGD